MPRPIPPRPILRSLWSPTPPLPARPIQLQQVPLKPVLAPAAPCNQMRPRWMGGWPVPPKLVPHNPTRSRLFPRFQVRQCPGSSNPPQMVRDLLRRSQRLRISLLPSRRMMMSNLPRLLRRRPRVRPVPSPARPCRHLPPHRCRLACRRRLWRVQLPLYRPPLRAPRPSRQLIPQRHVRQRLCRRRGR